MPSRSHVSLASGTGSSTKNNISVEKLQPPIALSPLARAMQTNLGNYESGLPPPVQHPHSLSSGRRGKKKTRIDDNARGNLRVHWAKFLRKIGTGTAPSSSSNFEGSTGESSGYNRHSRVTAEDVDEPLDEVVVDREWGDELKATSATHSEHAISPEKSGGSNQLGGPSTDRESLVIRAEGFWASWTPLIYLRWRVWPVVFGFFWTRFLDQKSEDQYSKENWFLRKVRLCLLDTCRNITQQAFIETSHMVIAVLHSQLDSCNHRHPKTRHSARHHLLLLSRPDYYISPYHHDHLRLPTRPSVIVSTYSSGFNVVLGHLSARVHAFVQLL